MLFLSPCIIFTAINSNITKIAGLLLKLLGVNVCLHMFLLQLMMQIVLVYVAHNCGCRSWFYQTSKCLALETKLTVIWGKLSMLSIQHLLL